MAKRDPGRALDCQVGEPATLAQLTLSEPRNERGIEKRPAGAQSRRLVRILVARRQGAWGLRTEHQKMWLGKHGARIEHLGRGGSPIPSRHRGHGEQARPE